MLLFPLQQIPSQRRAAATNKGWLLLTALLLLNIFQQPYAIGAVDDDVANISPRELDWIINQLINPSPQYNLHVAALRNQLNNILKQRQLAEGEEQILDNDYNYPEEDKRSVAALAAQGLLRSNAATAATAAKRSLATLAKNGQLPTQDPDLLLPDEDSHTDEKRYVGALARSGQGYGVHGKRFIGSLARNYQLPTAMSAMDKRNVATMARLGLLGNHLDAKRNLAAVARYKSQRYYNEAAAEKRNLAALKSSLVHNGYQQKRGEGDYRSDMEAADSTNAEELPVILDSYGAGNEIYVPAVYSYVDPFAAYWNYGTYADMDWNDYHNRAQKRFLAKGTWPSSNGPKLLPDKRTSETAHQTAEDFQDKQVSIDNRSDEGEQNFLGEDFTFEPDKDLNELYDSPSKRHIGAVYRSGFLPNYRAFHGGNIGIYGGRHPGIGGGRFSRTGRARQFVAYYLRPELLRQPIAAACKRCFLLNYRSPNHWTDANGVGRKSRDAKIRPIKHHPPTNLSPLTQLFQQRQQQQQQKQQQQQQQQQEQELTDNDYVHRITTNHIPQASKMSDKQQRLANEAQRHWYTPPRVAALQRRYY